MLYVGKAKNLKKRLASYAHLKRLLPKTRKLIETASYTRFQVTDTELDALILEAELVRLHQPPYNVLLKDDKSPLYIGITKDTYPSVITTRKNYVANHPHAFAHVFGPYHSGHAVKKLLRTLRPIFPYCSASQLDIKHHRPCFYYHLNLCAGPCAERLSAPDYQQIIHNLVLFLKGKKRTLVKNLIRETKAAAAKQDFNQAHDLHSKLQALLYITQSPHQLWQENPFPALTSDSAAHKLSELKRLLSPLLHLPHNYHFGRIEMYDVANLHGKSAAVAMVVALNGHVTHDEYRHFRIKSLATPNDPGMLAEALTRRQTHPEWGLPHLIILDGGKTQINGVRSVITWNTPLIGLAKNPDRLIVPDPHSSRRFHVITLDPHHPAAQLVCELRNEAHRFSRRYHHYLTNKAMFKADQP